MGTYWQTLARSSFTAAPIKALCLLLSAAPLQRALFGTSRSHRGHRASLAGSLLAATVFMTAVVVEAIAVRAADLVIVLDGSGSIWGRIDGTDLNKRDLVRGALSKGLRTHLPNAAVGLVTFGAQSNNSCQSASVLLPVKSGQLDEIDDLLEDFNPQGRGPIVLGLKTAIDSLPPSSATGSSAQRLLLIHDSADNCGQNVCALARDLAKTRPGILIDVLSVALKAEERGGMTCLTTATGGRLVEAANAEQVIAGLDGLLYRSRSTKPDVGPPLADRKTVSKSTSVVAPPISGLKLRLALIGGAVAVTRDVSWRITNISALDKPVQRTIRSATADITLPPATYRVAVEGGMASMERTISVAAGTRPEVVFEFTGGLIAFENTPASHDASAGLGATDDAIVTVTPDRSAVPLWSGPVNLARDLLLPAGGYTIAARNGLSGSTVRVDLVDGQAVAIALAGGHATWATSIAIPSSGSNSGSVPDMASRAGPATLVVTADDLRPEQQAGAEITVALDTPDSQGAPRIVARSAALQATFQLPAGSYRVSLRAYGAESSHVVILASGQTARQIIGLAQMTLQVSSHIGTMEQAALSDLRYRLWRADDLEQPISVSREAQPVFHLAPGKYRVESRIGLQNALIVREFEVGPGALGSLQLRHQAGETTLTLPEAANGPGAATYWQVLDDRKQLVWRTFDETPVMTLQTGTYEAIAQSGSVSYSAKFVVSAGRDQTVQLLKN